MTNNKPTSEMTIVNFETILWNAISAIDTSKMVPANDDDAKAPAQQVE